MAALTFESVNVQVDDLLEQLCIQLQLTDTQYNNATRSYGAVADWLEREGSSLRAFDPHIYVQGSMALGTTVKPREREEFDVDLVCVLGLDPDRLSPMHLYNLVHARLLEHEVYGPMVERRDRCVRLNYKGEFHLDIIPACPRPQYGNLHGELAIVIPDCDQVRWINTNPKGFVLWYAGQAIGYQREAIQLSSEPLPPNIEAGSKAVLQRITQLGKRRRDVEFEGHDMAPKSILLTTIDGMFHRRESSISTGIINILDQLIAQGRSHTHDVPAVPNPTDPNENLARHWKEDRRHYLKFIEHVGIYRHGMEELMAARDLPSRAEILNRLYDPSGTGVVTRAVKAYTDRFQRDRVSGDIRMSTSGRGLTTAAVAPAIAIAPTNFYGK